MNVTMKVVLFVFLFNFACVYSMERSHDIRHVEVDAQENKIIKDSRLLLDLPQDVLRSIIRWAGQTNQGDKRLSYDDVLCVITLFTRLSQTNKTLEQKLNMPNELKNIFGLRQNRLDYSLFRCSSQDKNELGFIFFKSLIAAGANPAYCAPEYLCRSCLFCISSERNYSINPYLAELYIKHGAQVNQKDLQGKTPLHMAAYFGRADIAKVLLAHNAQLDLKNKNEEMPINIVLKYAQLEVLKVFIRYDIDTSIQYKIWDNVMTIAEWAKKFNHLEIYKLVTGKQLSQLE